MFCVLLLSFCLTFTWSQRFFTFFCCCFFLSIYIRTFLGAVAAVVAAAFASIWPTALILICFIFFGCNWWSSFFFTRCIIHLKLDFRSFPFVQIHGLCASLLASTSAHKRIAHEMTQEIKTEKKRKPREVGDDAEDGNHCTNSRKIKIKKQTEEEDMMGARM